MGSYGPGYAELMRRLEESRPPLSLEQARDICRRFLEVHSGPDFVDLDDLRRALKVILAERS